MKAGARKQQSIGAGRWRCLLALSFGVMPIESTAQSGGVALRIELTADKAEDYHAWRRAQGLDAPAACGDARGGVRPLSPEVRRRLSRTLLLGDDGVWRPLTADRHALAAVGCLPAAHER